MRNEFVFCLLTAVVWVAQGQTTSRAQTHSMQDTRTAQNAELQVASPVPGQKWYVRDPRTGRLYLRELRSVQQTVQQIVQTEVPEPLVRQSAIQPRAQVPSVRNDYASSGRQPLIRIPILAQQQILPVSTRAALPAQLSQVGTNLSSAWRGNISSGAISNRFQARYSAPLSPQAPPSQTALRDSWQVGMPATVLR